DRVQLWRAGRPAEPLLPAPTLDHAAAARALDDLEPRHARSDLPAALRGVVDVLAAEDTRRDESIVVVLSDLSAGVAGGGAAGSGLGDETLLRRLDRSAKLLVARPTAGRSNVQIARLE